MATTKKEYKPLVSIITPMYNARKYIDKTFASVLSQTYKRWEWIIVDDGSADQSFKYVDSIINDSRIILLSLGKNHGTARARNVGLDHAKGDYIVFLDADDELLKTCLEEQISFIKENGPVITGAYYRKTSTKTTLFTPPQVIDFKKILKGNPISCLSTMYDFRVFCNERFDETIVINEDFLFWASILSKGYKAYGYQKPLATYNLHEGSKNNNKIKLLKPTFHIYRNKLKFGFFRSSYYLFSMCIYSVIKYRNIK